MSLCQTFLYLVVSTFPCGKGLLQNAETSWFCLCHTTLSRLVQQDLCVVSNVLRVLSPGDGLSLLRVSWFCSALQYKPQDNTNLLH
jgi:hypothetical protein